MSYPLRKDKLQPSRYPAMHGNLLTAPSKSVDSEELSLLWSSSAFYFFLLLQENLELLVGPGR
jgi:hypothetical protein